ncbi:hypothetical protein KR059_009751, partial [Drosophila kikkawai]
FAGKLLLATVLCLMGGSALGDQILEGNYNVTAFCTSVKPGTQLGSITSCNYYYVCSSTGPVLTQCQSGYAYDYAKSTCAPEGQVSCFWGVENPCAGQNGTWVPNTAVCGGYFWCLNGAKAGSGNCKTNQKFDSSSRQCVWGSCNSNLVESDEPNLSSLCEVVPPGVYFGDTENCNMWNYCLSSSTGVTLKTGTCTANSKTAFNVNTGNCDYESASTCSRVTDNPLSQVAASCTTSGAVKPDATVCGQYYQCKNQQWVGVACPTNYYFDLTSKLCQPRQQATPVAGCNRCQYADTKWVNAVDDSHCANYYYCNSNGIGSPVACPTSYYFNEQIQGCVSDDTLSTYASTNGACKGATAADNTSTTVKDDDAG